MGHSHRMRDPATGGGGEGGSGEGGGGERAAAAGMEVVAAEGPQSCAICYSTQHRAM